jgi:hypothetical protein
LFQVRDLERELSPQDRSQAPQHRGTHRQGRRRRLFDAYVERVGEREQVAADERRDREQDVSGGEALAQQETGRQHHDERLKLLQ